MQLNSTVFLLVRILGEIWLVLLLTRILPRLIRILGHRHGDTWCEPYSQAGK